MFGVVNLVNIFIPGWFFIGAGSAIIYKTRQEQIKTRLTKMTREVIQKTQAALLYYTAEPQAVIGMIHA